MQRLRVASDDPVGVRLRQQSVRVDTRWAAFAAIATWFAVPVVARAQPTDPPGGLDPSPSMAGPLIPGAPVIDEAKLRELVDREVARILTERAVKEAADRAAKEAADKEATSSEEPGDGRSSNGFMDTRLAFTITNENMLVTPGETVPSVPGWRFGTPGSLGVLFFDNYDTRYSGFETLSHAVMYREYTHGRLQAEGALVIRIDDLSESDLRLSDDGTYLTLSSWKDPTHKDPTRISLTAFPVSADRFRLGYSYRLSWGGNPEYRQSRSSPGLKVQYDGPNMYAFAGAKSSLVVDHRDEQQKAALAVLGGFGFDPLPMLRFEVNGGYFDRGYNALQDVQAKKVQLFGGSVQASIHQGMPVQSSVDYRLYKFSGESVSGLFAPEKYPGGFAWLAQSELTVLGQTLKDPEVSGSTVTQRGMAGDLNVRVKLDRIRLRLDLSYRDLAFILHSRPSLPEGQDFPATYTTSANYFGAVGVDRNWADWLTLGVIAGVEKPASFTAPNDAMGTTTTVIHDNNVDTLTTVLPAGERVATQIALKTTAKVDFAKDFSALFEVFYSHDGNQSRPRQTSPDATPEVEYGPFHQLGLNATLQARF